MDDLVRCPACGSLASVWAGSCSACDTDLSAAELVEALSADSVEPPAGEVVEPPAGEVVESLAGEVVAPPAGEGVEPSGAKHGGARKRIAAGSVALLSAAAAIAIWSAVAGSATRPWPRFVAGRAVVEVQQGRLQNFSSGHPGGLSQDFSDQVPHITGGPIQVSGEAVVAGDGWAFAFGGLTTVVLGQANAIYANVGGTGVWLLRTPVGSPATATLVAVTGVIEERTALLPPDTAVLADAGQGLLVREGTAPPMVWVPASGRITYRFPATFRDLVATGDPYEPHVAWRDDHCGQGNQCGLHLTNLATNTDELLSPPPGYRGFLPGGAFSPDDTPLAFDDTMLAAYVADPHHAGRTQVDVITTPDPAHFELSGDLAGLVVADGSLSAQWAPPGAPEALFVAGGKGMTVLDSQARSLRIAVPGSTRFAAL